jgi:predicted enzyme related to lactoylglutathione lyase
MVKDLAFVVYSVRDVPRAIAFYRDVLGLEPGEAFSEKWVEFNVGSCAFAVSNEEGLGFTPGASTGAAFEVDDINAMRERLHKHGVDITDVYEFPPCFAAFASDPDGNRFAIHQRKASG